MEQNENDADSGSITVASLGWFDGSVYLKCGQGRIRAIYLRHRHLLYGELHPKIEREHYRSDRVLYVNRKAHVNSSGEIELFLELKKVRMLRMQRMMEQGADRGRGLSLHC